jgi:FkbM family methyltransferase
MHFIPRLIRKLGLAPRLNFSARVIENSKAFQIPLLGGLGYSNLHLSERWMIELLTKTRQIFSGDGKTFVDVGVNIGQTLIKLKSVVQDIPYIGFEPNPTCVHYVTELIRLNDFKDVQIYPVGISDTAGVLSLYFYSNSPDDSAASLIEDFRPNERVFKSVHVPVYPAADLKLKAKIGFLKIDVEGGELEVIKGFLPIIQRDRPLILTEILPPYTAENIRRLERQEEIEGCLRELDYRCFRVLKQDQRLAGLQPLDRIGVFNQVDMSDFLWVPPEFVNLVKEIVVEAV